MFLFDLFKLNNDDRSVLSFNVYSVLTQKYGIYADVVSLSNFMEIIITAAKKFPAKFHIHAYADRVLFTEYKIWMLTQ